MGAELDSLLAALKRLESEVRSRRRKKRPRRPSTPSNSGAGANKGCGTGKGGFSAGNSCAKEDGIPNAPRRPPSALGPVNAKADLAKAKAMKEKSAKKQAEKVAAAKAKSEAYKKTPEYAQKQKQKRIDALRRKAAERKKEKGERDAAEKKAAQEAADKKRAALLQKIRIKKANERLNVVEKPDDGFSGKLDSSIKKRASETRAEFVERQMKGDFEKLDKQLEDMDKRHSAEIARRHKEWRDLDEAYSKQYEIEDKNATKLKTESGATLALEAVVDGKKIDQRSDALKALHAKMVNARKDLDGYRREAREEMQAAVGRLVASHGGAVQLPSTSSSYSISGVKSGAKNTGWLSDAWGFLSRVGSSGIKNAVLATKIKLRSSGGGNHSSGLKTITVGGESRTTAVHEYGHAIEDSSPSLMQALDEDFRSRMTKFMAVTPNAGMVRHPNVSYYDGPELPGVDGKRPKRNGYKSGTSLLGYSMRYSDFGYNDASRRKYGVANPRYGRGTEVFSTGLETLYSDPARLWRDHRSHFRLVVMGLSGRL